MHNNFFEEFSFLCKQEGFKEIGFSDAYVQTDALEKYKNWLNKGMNAEMEWMERNLESRLDIRKMFPWAKSYAIVLLPYFHNKTIGNKYSRYALLKDYHFVMKQKLRRVFTKLEPSYKEIKWDIFVDSKPLLEKDLLEKTAMAWRGKHSLMINKELGSWFFIGGIALNIEYGKTHKTEESLCGTCTLCIDSCPTSAIVEPYILDANRCISYNTIEKKGEIDEQLKEVFGEQIFGCDICQNVCPYNKDVLPNCDAELENEILFQYLKSGNIPHSSNNYKKVFGGTPLMRTAYKKFLSNLS